MSLTKAGIAIRKSNKIGRAAAVYVCDGRGQLARHDYVTLAEARQVAKDTARATGWPISDDPKQEGNGTAFDASAVSRGVAAVKAAIRPSPASGGSLVSRLKTKNPPRRG